MGELSELPVKRALTALAISVACVAAPATADVLEVSRNSILYEQTRKEVATQRTKCATGAMADSTRRLLAAGFRTLPTGAYCVTVLTRAGRDGTLRYVTIKGGETTPALAFDTGFVSAYLKGEALPAGLPTMAAVLPIADRCLDQQETNTRTCGLVGQVLGARAARGELVPVS